ncbi:MAG TPA: SRPBCC family protein [Kofleriaceae bacterium]|jgi:uncharacterized protein YndB with AHSA1/START domain
MDMLAKAANQSDSFTVERRSDVELVVARVFDAPARIVYAAFTKPEHMKRWWAPKAFGAIMYDCEIDLRVGGKYRYVFGKAGEPKMAFTGEFTEVVPNAKIVATQLFEQMPQAGIATITTTFVETNGATRLELVQHFPSKQALDGAIATGMTEGMKHTFGQLAELCAELR